MRNIASIYHPPVETHRHAMPASAQPKAPTTTVDPFLDPLSVVFVNVREIGGVDVYVHLGDVDAPKRPVAPSAALTKAARAHPHRIYLGIDLECFEPEASNAWHLQREFASGLQTLPDCSCSRITSNFALGYYDRDGNRYAAGPASSQSVLTREVIEHRQLAQRKVDSYCAELIDLAFKKLRIGGKLIVKVGEDALSTVKKPICNSGFKQRYIAIKPIVSPEPTPWELEFRKRGVTIWKIVALKTWP